MRRAVMQLFYTCQKVIEKLLPSGIRRSYYYQLGLVGIRVILHEGWHSFWFKAKRRLKHKIVFGKVDPYQLWIIQNEPKAEELDRYRPESLSFQYRPKISLITPVWNTDMKWLRLAIESVLNQVYDNWELCLADDASTKPYVSEILRAYEQKDERIKVKFLSENLGISGASNEALSLATGEFVGFLDHDDELRPDALFEVVKLLNQDSNLDLIYTDEDKIDNKGKRMEAFFKPDWSPDLLMSMNYICHFTVIRKDLVDSLGGFCRGFDGSQDYDLILRTTEKSSRIAHIPKPLYSWRRIPGSSAASIDAKPYACSAAVKALQESLDRRGIEGDVVQYLPGCYRVRYTSKAKPLVSIIIPTKDNSDKLRRCIESVESKTTYQNYEVIIIDHDSQDPETIDYLKSLKHKVVKYSGEYNFSKMNNLGVRETTGEHIVFLNNDTEVIEPKWLEAMLEHSQRPEVGMVGALLLYPPKSPFAGKIQHAGILLGIGVANHAFKYIPAESLGYFGLAKVIRNCIAVTAACAMIKKSLFEEFGGFDENLPIAYNDVDLCLRLREKGYLIVYTPYAVLYHEEYATRGEGHPPEDETNTLARWADTIAKGDPYYNRNLTFLREDYSIAPRPSTNIPLAVLLELYYCRPDLHMSYPEVAKGEYQRLIDWAVDYGITIDGARHLLRPYFSWYVNNASEEFKPLAILLELYNLRSDLQAEFPEVLHSDYQRLQAWASEVTATSSDHDDPVVERLLAYKSYDPFWLEKEFAKLGSWITQFVIHGKPHGGERSFEDDVRIPWFLNSFPEARAILDLGSLEGGQTFQLAKRPGIQVLGIEGRQSNIERAKFAQRVLGIKNVKFVLADLETCDLSKFGQFDAVFCSGVLYHMPQPWKLIDKIRAVTKKLFIWTHYVADDKADQVVNGFWGWWYYKQGLEDSLSGLSLKSFWLTFQSLQDMLKRYGFTRLKILENNPQGQNGPCVTVVAWANQQSLK